MTTVDARGLSCPLPLAMAKARIAYIEPGEQLVVLADDPESPIDLGAWASDDGHECSTADRGGWYEIVLTKCKS